jgi:hypothetical protein
MAQRAASRPRRQPHGHADGGHFPLEQRDVPGLDLPDRFRRAARRQRQQLLRVHLSLGAGVRDHGPLERHRVRRGHGTQQPGDRRADRRPEQPLARHARLPALLLRGQRGRWRHPGDEPGQHRLGRGHVRRIRERRRHAPDAHARDQHRFGLPLPRGGREHHPAGPAGLQPEPESRRAGAGGDLLEQVRPRSTDRQLHERSAGGPGDRLRVRRPGRRLHQHGPGRPRRDEQGRDRAAHRRHALRLSEPGLLPPGLALGRPAVPLPERRARRVEFRHPDDDARLERGQSRQPRVSTPRATSSSSRTTAAACTSSAPRIPARRRLRSRSGTSTRTRPTTIPTSTGCGTTTPISPAAP